MRSHQILREAHIQNIEVVGGDGDYRFDVTLDQGAIMHVFADLDFRTGVLKIIDIWTRANDHPDAFSTRSKNHSEYYIKGVRLGPGETRRLLRFILNQTDQFAKVTSIEGSRVTGARAFYPNRATSVNI